MDVYGFPRSTIIQLIDFFRKGYSEQLIIGSDYLPLEHLSSDVIYNCILFINSYTVTTGYKLIQHLKPRGVLCVIDPSGNDDIHTWLDDDYSSYRLVHQVFTYSDFPDETTPRIIWMTRRDVPIVKHSMPDRIKIVSEPPVISYVDNLQNNCLVM
jgi:hypothetical protein